MCSCNVWCVVAGGWVDAVSSLRKGLTHCSRESLNGPARVPAGPRPRLDSGARSSSDVATSTLDQRSLAESPGQACEATRPENIVHEVRCGGVGWGVVEWGCGGVAVVRWGPATNTLCQRLALRVEIFLYRLRCRRNRASSWWEPLCALSRELCLGPAMTQRP